MRTQLSLSVFLCLGMMFPSASPVRDVVTEQLALGFHWCFPWSYVFLAPFCGLADMLTVSSMKEMMVFLGYGIAACIWIPARKRTKGAALLFFLAFLGSVVLVPRPMARLVAGDPDCLLIDFHSHTSFSHDGRRSFTPAANRRWHERQGFGAAFITDHNVIDGNLLMKDSSPYFSLQGEEVSLYNTHIGVLGNAELINHSLYDSNYSQISLFISDMRKKGYPVIAHLPEYWREHWKEGNIDFLNWKVDGFEILNSVPYCLDFPLPRQREVIAHCRRNNLFVTGVSDNHGWGSATAAWSVMRIPGWRAMAPGILQQVIVSTLKREGFRAVQVLERRRYHAESAWHLAISPAANFFVWLCTMGKINGMACMVWIWAGPAICKFCKRLGGNVR